MAWPPAPEALSTAQLSRYLTYVGLDPDATLARPRDRALLAAVQRAHLLRVPFDTTALHIPSAANEASDTPFTFGRGPGMPLALGAMFTRVVDEARGGYCFLMNTLFAAVLRAIGFTVKECLARAHPQHIRPWQDGWAWQSATHVSGAHSAVLCGSLKPLARRALSSSTVRMAAGTLSMSATVQALSRRNRALAAGRKS
jgi:hypothetical protein